MRPVSRPSPRPAPAARAISPPRPVLVADLGGTNTRIALADGAVLRQGSIRRYRNAEAPDIAPLLHRYRAEMGSEPVAAACLSVAGPVERCGRLARMTNLDWQIDAPALEGALDLPRVALLNDLQAQGHALAHLPARHLITILPGQPEQDPRASRLVVGAGTGFNAAPVHVTDHGPVVPASECGHAHLPRHGATEEAFARHLAAAHGIATIEDALCGRGLEALHHWLTGSAADAASIMAALAAGDAAATRSGRLYAALLGRTLASLALTHLPFGGIYLIGGVARAFAPHLAALGLADGFSEMGRFSEMMQRIPIHAVSDDYAALTGCAAMMINLRAN